MNETEKLAQLIERMKVIESGQESGPMLTEAQQLNEVIGLLVGSELVAAIGNKLLQLAGKGEDISLKSIIDLVVDFARSEPRGQGAMAAGGLDNLSKGGKTCKPGQPGCSPFGFVDRVSSMIKNFTSPTKSSGTNPYLPK